jgi:hypothetical protein
VQRPPSATTRADAGRRADGEALQGLEALGAPGTARSGAPVVLDGEPADEQLGLPGIADGGAGKQLWVGNGIDGGRRAAARLGRPARLGGQG